MKRRKIEELRDEQIIELYFGRNEDAIAETDRKYGKYLFTVAYNVLHDKSDCEECVNDTYLGAWKAMPPTRPNVLKAFLTAITRRVAIKRYHSNMKKRAIPSEMTVSLTELENIISADGDIVEELDTERLGQVLSAFIRSLPDRKRFIFMSRYYAADPIDTIARDLRVSRSTVNKELASIRAELQEILVKEGLYI